MRTTNDDLGTPKDYDQFKTELVNWADFSALNTMPTATVQASGVVSESAGTQTATLTLKNNSNHIAFFLRAEIASGQNGEEILPIFYDDNYVTLFPRETRTLTARFKSTSAKMWLNVEGYNVVKSSQALATK